jgi:hypothetical protein
MVLPYLRDIGVSQPDLVAWVSVALWRLVSVVSEVLISGILYVGGMRWRGGSPPHSPQSQSPASDP